MQSIPKGALPKQQCLRSGHRSEVFVWVADFSDYSHNQPQRPTNGSNPFGMSHPGRLNADFPPVQAAGFLLNNSGF
jgi:hypothetical protein